MSDQTPTPIEQAPVTEVHIVPNRPRKVYSGMWGPVEIGVMAAGGMAFLAAIIFYLFFVVPSNRDLATNRAKADSLDAEVASARTKYGEITSTQDQVKKVLSSVDDFETQYLPAVSNGQQALYQRLNGLILQNGLVNTSGPDYQPLDLAEIQNGQQQSQDDKGRDKFRSLYPGVYVSMTVEGSYQNLRHFIQNVETGSEFLTITAVELAPSDTQGAKPETQAAPVSRPSNKPGSAPVGPFAATQPVQPRQQGKMHGEVVALHIEMAAYFRRPNFAPMTTGAQQ
ncbi:MAG: hypothetical protein JO314_08185 [Acidobacteria bacterium]|nr:hypothetical protein [Acidobacteriota bacterium]